jgi:pSer/pThr/pTyr-binding forkhead associated (FHA) protein
MANPNSLADPSPDSSAENESDLEQRLGLYQVFLKLYEHHRELLNEILDLENTDRAQIKGVWQYIQAGVESEQVYLVTNLLQGHTQKLFQSQNCWVIGRDRKAGLSVQDKRLSRRHAMIRYIPRQGFYLIDLNSTNGTYLNGEAVRQPILLKEGDRIRLGSLSFVFFTSQDSQLLPDVSPELLNTGGFADLHSAKADQSAAIAVAGVDLNDMEAPLPGSEKETSLFPQPLLSEAAQNIESGTPDLSTAQKSEILDRFLNR